MVCVFLQALGNHEFDNGVDGLLKPFLQDVNCTVLSANIKANQNCSQISGYYLPYKIFTVNSEKVGVVGYTSMETPALSLPGKILYYSRYSQARFTHNVANHTLKHFLIYCAFRKACFQKPACRLFAIKYISEIVILNSLLIGVSSC